MPRANLRGLQMNFKKYSENRRYLVISYVLILGLSSFTRFLPKIESMISSTIMFFLGLLIVYMIRKHSDTDKSEGMFLLIIFLLSQIVFYINIYRFSAIYF